MVQPNQPMMSQRKKSRHNPSRADDMDNSHIQHDIFPPAPVATTKPNSDYGVPEPSICDTKWVLWLPILF